MKSLFCRVVCGHETDLFPVDRTAEIDLLERTCRYLLSQLMACVACAYAMLRRKLFGRYRILGAGHNSISERRIE
jgi:hypothetical protein